MKAPAAGRTFVKGPIPSTSRLAIRRKPGIGCHFLGGQDDAWPEENMPGRKVWGFAGSRFAGPGGTKKDSIYGGPGNDRLLGGVGEDRVSGGAANDRLPGGGGKDRVSGGGGKDRITSADGTKETVNCGAGRDFVRADRADRVRGCERIRRR
jgi:hypothetical protein